MGPNFPSFSLPTVNTHKCRVFWLSSVPQTTVSVSTPNPPPRERRMLTPSEKSRRRNGITWFWEFPPVFFSSFQCGFRMCNKVAYWGYLLYLLFLFDFDFCLSIIIDTIYYHWIIGLYILSIIYYLLSLPLSAFFSLPHEVISSPRWDNKNLLSFSNRSSHPCVPNSFSEWISTRWTLHLPVLLLPPLRAFIACPHGNMWTIRLSERNRSTPRAIIADARVKASMDFPPLKLSHYGFLLV